MILPQAYLDVIVRALVALRPGAPAFAPADVAGVFGPQAPAGVGLPASTAPVECVRWLETLQAEHVKLIARHLLGLDTQHRVAIEAWVIFEQIAEANSLARVDGLVVVNRTRLLSNLRELRMGTRPMMRVSGKRGTGKSFTTDVIEEVLGATIGSDQDVIEIDLAGYAREPVARAFHDIFARRSRKPELPTSSDVTPPKYLEQLGQLVVRGLLDGATGTSRTWLVFDRCAVASELPDVATFLQHVAATARKYAKDLRCPRVIFLEADAELLRRYESHLVVEELDEIEHGEIDDFLLKRGVDPALRQQFLVKLQQDLIDLQGREWLEEMQASIQDFLNGAQA